MSVNLVDLQPRLHTPKRQWAVGGLFSDILQGKWPKKKRKQSAETGRNIWGKRASRERRDGAHADGRSKKQKRRLTGSNSAFVGRRAPAATEIPKRLKQATDAHGRGWLVSKLLSASNSTFSSHRIFTAVGPGEAWSCGQTSTSRSPQIETRLGRQRVGAAEDGYLLSYLPEEACHPASCAEERCGKLRRHPHPIRPVPEQHLCRAAATMTRPTRPILSETGRWEVPIPARQPTRNVGSPDQLMCGEMQTRHVVTYGVTSPRILLPDLQQAIVDQFECRVRHPPCDANALQHDAPSHIWMRAWFLPAGDAVGAAKHHRGPCLRARRDADAPSAPSNKAKLRPRDRRDEAPKAFHRPSIPSVICIGRQKEARNSWASRCKSCHRQIKS